MVTAADARFMERALFLAERGRGTTSPNPVVGAVVVVVVGIVVSALNFRRGVNRGSDRG